MHLFIIFWCRRKISVPILCLAANEDVDVDDNDDDDDNVAGLEEGGGELGDRGC